MSTFNLTYVGSVIVKQTSEEETFVTSRHSCRLHVIPVHPVCLQAVLSFSATGVSTSVCACVDD